ncbi:unnamed protein product [Aureobasidium mustum]|uniref:Uncharacterized protein n=1 Tax=Aureobasidium mustum TaxID=2773714 RepID=A0A9N8PHQ0_9PEZI|nr:unnamed protein product [Aureobasidium mustum]
MVRVLGIVDDRLTCIDPNRDPDREWQRAVTPALTLAQHFAQIKEKEAAACLLESVDKALEISRKEEKGTVQLRGSENYVEPRIDYCSRISRFRPVRDGLIVHPSWERQDFSALLKMWCVESPQHRHSRAAYAFNLDGTPTIEYEKALSIYAQQRMDAVEAHSRDYALKKAGRVTGRTVLRLATAPVRSEGIQKQQVSSQIDEDEEDRDEQRRKIVAKPKAAISPRHARGRVSKPTNAKSRRMNTSSRGVPKQSLSPSQDGETLPRGLWCKKLEGRANINECYRKRREDTLREREGLSPDPQRAEAEAKREQHEATG